MGADTPILDPAVRLRAGARARSGVPVDRGAVGPHGGYSVL